MQTAINILFVEDSKNDCDLILLHLSENGYQPISQQVDTELDMNRALNLRHFDVIICDHNMPSFDIFTALAIANTKCPEVPFIVMSGAVSEAIAVKSVKGGAKDYILKNNLARLGPAITREIAEAKSRAHNLQIEKELEKKDLELQQARKLEVVGQLAGGIAHDFNNILSIILIQVENTLETFNLNSEINEANKQVYKNLEHIKKTAERAANLTHQLLAFSRKQIIQPKVLNINDTVCEMDEMLRCIIEGNIGIELQLDKDSKNIKIDPSHLQQIIINLVVNSRDAMPNGGKIIIKTENIILNQESALLRNVNAGWYTVLEVSDNGYGMSEETRTQILIPFFTTKDVGKGTGLGLSTVYGIVNQNFGFMLCESKLGEGTTFKIYFPQSNEQEHKPTLVMIQPDVQGRNETILVAEDCSELRELICELLRSYKYTVLAAKDGLEALKHIMTYKEKIHLVISDMIMPNMGGAELFKKAKVANSGIKFLFLSGHAVDDLIQIEINSGQTHFLEKPCAKSVLVKKVQSILNGEAQNAANN